MSGQEIPELIEELGRRTEKFGLYIRHAAVASQADEEADTEVSSHLASDQGLKEKLIKGEIRMAIFATFTLNEFAFSDRIQFPEQDKTRTEFDVIMPSPVDVAKDEILSGLGAAETDDDILAALDDGFDSEDGD